MTKRELSSHEGLSKGDERKLKKRKKRLQEAREAQNWAEERLRRAQALLQKSSARVKKLEERLHSLQTHEETEQIAQHSIAQPRTHQAQDDFRSSQSSAQNSDVFDEAPEVARARTIAHVVELSARQAIEQALAVSEHPDHLSTERHLKPAEQTHSFALETGRSAGTSEQLTTMLESTHPESEILRKEPAEVDQETDTPAHEEHRSEERERTQPDIEEIEEEEELVERVVAMMVADAAATAAAEAEALAEASRARTREARLLASQADQMVALVRAAIEKGSLIGEEAASALQAAEREATTAHALLADAEAAEEHALTAARYAEADAEVAEGMAFATEQREEEFERTATIQKEQRHMSETIQETDAPEVDEDATLKIPIVHPQSKETN